MPEVNIEFDVPAKMRDGTVLRADIYRPGSGGPWPVLLSRLPYGKNQTGTLSFVDPVSRAKRGFMVVVQDVRGRFASDGDWEPYTFEESDGYDTVGWAAALPGANGSVGMFGGSYFGNTQWMAALAKPPELKAIAPALTWSEPDDGLFARGGATELGLSVPWSLVQGLDTVMRRHAADPVGGMQALGALLMELDNVATSAYWELPVGKHPAFVRHGIAELGCERSRREPEWSASCRVAGRHSEVGLPTFHIGGWYDIYCQGTLDNFAAMREADNPATLVMGPWVHGSFAGQIGDVNFGIAASGDLVALRGSLTDLQSDWFERWMSADTEAEGAPVKPELPPVLLFVMGTNEWREEQEWPLARAEETDLFLRADGRLAHEPPGPDEGVDTFVYDPADPVMTTGGALLLTSEFRPGPLDQATVEARSDVLVYSTDPLETDVEVTGRVRAVLYAATDAPSTDWVVRLCDVDADGVSRNVVDGIVRATSPDSEHGIDLWSTSYVFRAGHRMRVHVTSSNFPRWDRNLNTGEPNDRGTESRPAQQTVGHSMAMPSRIILPIVPPGT
ncbi:CocE/NonD family hydrolase [Streptomyces sp. NPDC002680]|uniref:CocE/NonD family hydrolase n=1 Tax=Streptomyces sp. NPDC002680 TaxID=3364659 RepID=UPI003679D285